MQLLMVVLAPQHQPRHLQRDVHSVISTGRKRLVPGHTMSFPTSCKSKKRGPSSRIIRPLLRKKAAGVGRQLCSSMVGVGCSAPSQRNHDWTHNTLLPPRRASPYHMLPDDSTNLPPRTSHHEPPLVANSISTYDGRLFASRMGRTSLATGPSPAQNDRWVPGRSPQLRRAPGALNFVRHMTSSRAVPMSTRSPVAAAQTRVLPSRTSRKEKRVVSCR